MKTILNLAIISILAICLTTPGYGQLIDWNRVNKIRQKEKETNPERQFQGVIISKNIGQNKLTVENMESGEQKTFILNDKDLLDSLHKNDNVQVTFQNNSDTAKSVTLQKTDN